MDWPAWMWFEVTEHGASLSAWRGDTVSFGIRGNWAQMPVLPQAYSCLASELAWASARSPVNTFFRGFPWGLHRLPLMQCLVLPPSVWSGPTVHQESVVLALLSLPPVKRPRPFCLVLSLICNTFLLQLSLTDLPH